MTAGRKPAPVALQLLKGDGEGRDSAGRVIKHPPKFRREAPEKPDTLTDYASEMWDELIDDLEELDILKRIDGPALAMVCETYSTWRTARDQRAANGITTAGSMGQDTVAPWVRVEAAAAKEFRSWCAEFGLTPSAEMKLAKEPQDDDGEENPFA